jgi:hypothetical protein
MAKPNQSEETSLLDAQQAIKSDLRAVTSSEARTPWARAERQAVSADFLSSEPVIDEANDATPCANHLVVRPALCDCLEDRWIFVSRCPHFAIRTDDVEFEPVVPAIGGAITMSASANSAVCLTLSSSARCQSCTISDSAGESPRLWPR